MKKAKTEGINLFLAESPLQLINCIEAAHYSSDPNNVLIIKLSGRVQNDSQMKNLIERHNWLDIHIMDFSNCESRVKRHLHELYFVLQMRKKYKEVKKLFFGEFRCPWMLNIRSIIAADETFLVDDGDVTLTIQEVYLRPNKGRIPQFYPGDAQKVISRVLNKMRSSILRLFCISTQLNFNSSINLFTTFEIEAVEKQKIIRNRFNYFKSISCSSRQYDQKVYYFGSKYSEAGVLKISTEIDFLKDVEKFFSQQGLSVYYIPHRDDSVVKIERLRKETNFEIKYLNEPAEVYFLTQNIKPKIIAAAYSSVLNNLCQIIELKLCYSFKLPLSKIPNHFRVEVGKSYDNFERLGIDVIDFYN